MKKAALHNLGCKVNAYETEAMQEMLEQNGYEIVPFKEYKILDYKVTPLKADHAKNLDPVIYIIEKDGLYEYEHMKSNAVVKGSDGELYYADYKFSESFIEFEKEYEFFDKENNIGRYQRNLYYDDYVAPRLHFDRPMLHYAAEDISALSGVRLIDCIDGDISHKLKLEASNVAASVPGIYEIEISAVSDFGDEIHVRLPLNIIEYSADTPEIALSQYLVYTKKGQEIDPLTYITSVTDSNGVEMDIADVKVSSQVDFQKEGAGQMLLEITNKHGVIGITYLTVIVEA